MVQTFILFESPSGYALFEAKGVEGIALNSESIQQSIKKFDNFGKIVKLIAFSPFKSARDALENVNCISEGIVSETLKNFLETYFPKSKFGKKASTLLGVAHSSFCAQVKDATGIFCESSDVHTELIRGIRQHFSKFVKSHREGDLEKAQLGLGHSYSRAKVKFNVHRIDNMVIQAISLLDQLDKDLNKFAMRAKEWYGYHFPELARYCEDNHTYALCARAVGNRSHASDDSDVLEKLEEILHDSDKALQILRASKMSMGYDISDFDYIHIQMFLERVARLSEYRGELHVYLREKMNTVAPNLSELIGEIVGARLIAQAGSLTNLSKCPASTVQILGAEKALFRALKTRGKTPKYGLLYHSSFIGRATQKNKGRISRYLANKCAHASRIDCFMEEPTNAFGKALHSQVEERLHFYQTGATPKKNIEVMRSVISELNRAASSKDEGEERVKKSKKKKKKDKKSSKTNKLKRKLEDTEDDTAIKSKKKLKTLPTPEKVSKKKKDKKS